VYVAGFSAGGAMAAIMAATYPDLYAAVGVHSAPVYATGSPSAAMNRAAPGQARQPGGVIPGIVFHGDRDQIVDRVNADRLLDRWRQAANQQQSTVARPAPATTVERGRVTGGYAYTRSIYDNAADGTVAEQWIIHQAGHAWSGGSPRGPYADPQGPDASTEMVRFFDQHPKKQPAT
jgi:poly(3-hydroxybutyrate) depolymerase